MAANEASQYHQLSSTTQIASNPLHSSHPSTECIERSSMASPVLLRAEGLQMLSARSFVIIGNHDNSVHSHLSVFSSPFSSIVCPESQTFCPFLAVQQVWNHHGSIVSVIITDHSPECGTSLNNEFVPPVPHPPPL